MNKKIFILFFFGILLKGHSQNGFQFLGNTKEQIIPFELANNIIIIPMEVNGKELSFILDTGVSKSLLFNLNSKDSLTLNNVKKVILHGLGNQEPIKALLSKKNTFRHQKIYSNNQDIYVILNDSFELSSRLGTTIHGIIGTQFFENFIVEVNYIKKKLYIYDPKYYTYSKCKKCVTIPLEFYNNRPYMDVQIIQNTKNTTVKLLLDSGSSDSLWLFENETIKVPEKFFLDFLGVGLSGNVTGKRSRIQALHLDKFTIKEPTVAYPDSLSVPFLKTFTKRNGSIGGGVLSRFNTIYDYKNKKITLKKNRTFKNSFQYNMTGIEVVYSGKILVKELRESSHIKNDSNNDNNVTILLGSHYTFKFKPSYQIHSIREGSPAQEVGLLAKDVLLEINNKPVYNYTLEQIYGLLYKKDAKKIEILVERNGIELGFVFKLRKLL